MWRNQVALIVLAEVMDWYQGCVWLGRGHGVLWSIFHCGLFQGNFCCNFLTLTCTIYYRLLEAAIGSYLLAFEGIYPGLSGFSGSRWKTTNGKGISQLPNLVSFTYYIIVVVCNTAQWEYRVKSKLDLSTKTKVCVEWSRIGLCYIWAAVTEKLICLAKQLIVMIQKCWVLC